MSKWSGSLKVAAIIMAATVGDGIFALPFVFSQSGWLVGIIYLLILGSVIITAHVVYLKALEKVGEKERLLGLAKKYLGSGGFWVGFVAIIAGLLLTLVAYLLLGTQFLRLLFPSILPYQALLLFWFFTSLTVLASDRDIVQLELAGILFTTSIVVIIFASAWPNVTFTGIPAINSANLFLPFGVVLFSLAGWPGIEPAYESRKRTGRKNDPARALALGTAAAAALSLMFAAGILGSAPHITSDTLSGLLGWPAWKRDILAILGICAVTTVFLPISREIKNSLEKDLRWNKALSRTLIIVFPILCVALGLRNFLTVVGVVGGLFLSTQYLLIVWVGRKVLELSLFKKVLLDIVAIVFLCAALYQIYSFIVR